jgi:hypothetical protein
MDSGADAGSDPVLAGPADRDDAERKRQPTSLVEGDTGN